MSFFQPFLTLFQREKTCCWSTPISTTLFTACIFLAQIYASPLVPLAELSKGQDVASTLLLPDSSYHALKEVPDLRNDLPVELKTSSDIQKNIHGMTDKATSAQFLDEQAKLVRDLGETTLSTKEIQLSEHLQGTSVDQLGDPKNINEFSKLKVQDEILKKKDNILQGLWEARVHLEAQDEVLEHVARESLKESEKLDQSRTEAFHLLISKMQKDENGAESWFNKLKVLPQDVHPHTEKEWLQLMSRVEDTYRKASDGVRYPGFFSNLFKLIFQNSKWKEQRLALKFQQIRSRSLSRPLTNYEAVVLDLEKVREAGLPLSKEELDLVHKTALGEHAKFNEEDFNLIHRLSELSITQRRVEQLATILNQMLTKVGKWEKSTEKAAKTTVAAVKALWEKQQNARPWTPEEIDLINSLLRVKDMRRLDNVLSTDQMKLLHVLSDRYEEQSSTPLYERALIMLNLKQTEQLSGEHQVLLQKLQRKLMPQTEEARGATQATDETMDFKLNENEKALAYDLDQEYIAQMTKFSRHATPKSSESIEKLSKGVFKLENRAREILHHLPESHPSRDSQLYWMDRIYPMITSPTSKTTPGIEKLAADFMETAHQMSPEQKAKEVLKLLGPDSSLISEFSLDEKVLKNLRHRIKKGKFSEKESAQIYLLADVYDDMVKSMTAAEKAKCQEIAYGAQHLGSSFMDVPLVITLSDRFRVAFYSKLHPSPPSEERAIQILKKMREGKQMTQEHADILQKLEKQRLSLIHPKDQAVIENLATESLILDHSRVSDKVQETAIRIMQGSKLGELHPHDLQLLQNLQKDELEILVKLTSSQANDDLFKTRTKFTQISQLLSTAEKRRNLVEWTPEELKSVYTVIREVSQLRTKYINNNYQRLEDTQQLHEGLDALLRNKLDLPEISKSSEDISESGTGPQTGLDHPSHSGSEISGSGGKAPKGQQSTSSGNESQGNQGIIGRVTKTISPYLQAAAARLPQVPIPDLRSYVPQFWRANRETVPEAVVHKPIGDQSTTAAPNK